MDTVKPPDWQLLCVARNPMEATFIQGRLESAGIRVRAAGETLAELYGLTFGDLARVRMYVPREQSAEARQLLEAELAADHDVDNDRADGDRAAGDQANGDLARGGHADGDGPRP